jgi:hypothetical protein
LYKLLYEFPSTNSSKAFFFAGPNSSKASICWIFRKMMVVGFN